VISGDLQMIKPEREIFEFLLQRYGLVAAQTVFIDDNAPNIAGARGRGHPRRVVQECPPMRAGA